MNHSLKVTLSCGLGAYIGGLVAFNINHWFWWVGILVGGIAGYLTYELKKAFAAIPKAWNAANAWQPDREWWHRFYLASMQWAGLMSCFVPAFAVFFWLSSPPGARLQELRVDLFGLALVIPAVGLLFGFGFASNPYLNTTESLEKEAATDLCNPFKLYFVRLPRFLWKLLRSMHRRIKPGAANLSSKTWKFFGMVAAFLWELFREIHSEIRLLCGIDAALGTAIGYSFHHILACALAGALIGFLNFEILSIRVFKFVPRTASLF